MISSIVRRDLGGAAFFQLSSLMWQEEPQKTYQSTFREFEGTIKAMIQGAKWIRNVQK